MIQDNLTYAVIPHGAHWCIEEASARQFWKMLLQVDAGRHRQEYEAQRRSEEEAAGPSQDSPSKPFEFSNGIAVLSLSGPMTKADTSWGSGTSTSRLRRKVNQASADPDVKGIFLIIDSPGGSVAGTSDLAQAIAKAAKLKPVYAFFEDQTCSAALWVGSQSTKVYANSMAVVGSIGTYMVLEDSSEQAANDGIKVHLIKSDGLMKGAGVDGVPISDDQLADFRRVVLDMNQHFLQALMAGRGMTPEKVKALATGQVWVGAEAVQKGLVDAISTVDEAFNALLQACAASQAPKTPEMATKGQGDALTLAISGTVITPEPKITAPAAVTPQNTTISATSGGTGPSGAGIKVLKGPGEPKHMKNLLVRALTRFGLGKMAVAVVSAESEEPEEMAALMAQQVDAEVTSRIADNPLFMACEAAGIRTAVDVEKVMEAKRLGDKYLADIRGDAKAQAVRAYGAEAGPAIASQVDLMPAATVEALRNSWRAQADAQFGLNPDKPAGRQTAPTGTIAAPADIDTAAQDKKPWDQLTKAEQDMGLKMGMKTPEDQEAFAKTHLVNKEAK